MVQTNQLPSVGPWGQPTEGDSVGTASSVSMVAHPRWSKRISFHRLAQGYNRRKVTRLARLLLNAEIIHTTVSWASLGLHVQHCSHSSHCGHCGPASIVARPLWPKQHCGTSVVAPRSLWHVPCGPLRPIVARPL